MACDEYCAGCVFFSSSTRSCNYILVMDIRRGCQGGAGCDKKMTKKEFNLMGIPKAWDKEAGRQMFLAGKGDAEIARACGVTQGTISYFRKKHWETEGNAECKMQDAECDAFSVQAGIETAPEAASAVPPPHTQHAERHEEAMAKVETDHPKAEESKQPDSCLQLISALEEATGGLNGMNAVMTAQIITALWQWKDASDLREAKACLDYLIRRNCNE